MGELKRRVEKLEAQRARPGAVVPADPVALMEVGGLSPDPWQREVLTTPAKRLLLLCCRQAGKSTTTAGLALHEALARPGALVLMLAPSLRQAAELFRKAVTLNHAVGAPIPTVQESALSCEFTNGSRIVSLPGKEATVRGYSGVALLAVDEAARVPDELYFAIRPMLAVSNGRLIALSTPFGARGWFHREWTEGGGDWKRVKVPATRCPRISAEFLAEERRSMGEWWYSQEYDPLDFRDAIDQVFRYDDIQAALSDEVQPLFGGDPIA